MPEVEVASFNSIVVRLKAPERASSGDGRSCFNSIVVRLKDARIESIRRILLGFNSIVVRLKGESSTEMLKGSKAFQFHSGSIKRSPIEFLCLFLQDLFQFHSGSIKSPPWGVVRTSSAAFQFHSGSIKRKQKHSK